MSSNDSSVLVADGTTQQQQQKKKSYAALKRQKRRQKKKEQKTQEKTVPNGTSSSGEENGTSQKSDIDGDVQMTVKVEKIEDGPLENGTSEQQQPEEEEEEVVWVGEEIELDPYDSATAEFQQAFARFMRPEELTSKREETEDEDEDEEEEDPEAAAKARAEARKKAKEAREAAKQKKAVQIDAGKRLSKRERKLKDRLTIAELKQLVDRPDLVEPHDCNSSDPKLLIHLKSYRNTVPVPRHWCQKRKYLQGKRGIEKRPWELPAFIADTGIGKLRGAQVEKDSQKKQSQLMRQRMQPKLGKIDIDYQVLHDAFFRYQTKPHMSGHGELYYEGKEFEVVTKEKRPGELSDELIRALGMPNRNAPPPWLYNMQRYGPPPSYPNLKIPGVTCPIPPGARYGYGEGEWGKPPVDEYGRPLYGDVFGTAQTNSEQLSVGVDRTHWGQIIDEPDEEIQGGYEGDEEKEEEEEEVKASAPAATRTAAEAKAEALRRAQQLQSGIESVSSVPGIETPEAINLRKSGTGTETPGTVAGGAPRPLYVVLEEKAANVSSSQLFGTSHTYVIPQLGAAGPESEADKKLAERKARMRDEVTVSINPDELVGDKIDTAAIKRKYDEELAASRQTTHEDVSDVVAEQAKKKRKIEEKKEKDSKYSKFKF